MFGFALKYLKSKEEAEGLVQDVFLKIWENRKTLKVGEMNLVPGTIDNQISQTLKFLHKNYSNKNFAVFLFFAIFLFNKLFSTP